MDKYITPADLARDLAREILKNNPEFEVREHCEVGFAANGTCFIDVTLRIEPEQWPVEVEPLVELLEESL